MPGKTAYEIRASLLELAFDILKAKAQAESGLKASENKDICYITTSPTTEEVIKEASKLNDFVSTKAT